MGRRVLLFLSSCVFLPVVAFAQSNNLQTYGPTYDIKTFIHSVEMAAGLVFGAIAVICFIMAGVLFLTAQGSAEKLTQARSAFIWGVAGVVIGILAFSIIAIVGSFLK